MAKRQASLLSFCQSTHKRQRQFEEKADGDHYQESDDSDHQDKPVEYSPKESEEESEHSCHDPLHMMSITSPQFFGDLLVSEVVSLNKCIVRPCWLFVLNVTLITQ